MRSEWGAPQTQTQRERGGETHTLTLKRVTAAVPHHPVKRAHAHVQQVRVKPPQGRKRPSQHQRRQRVHGDEGVKRGVTVARVVDPVGKQQHARQPRLNAELDRARRGQDVKRPVRALADARVEPQAVVVQSGRRFVADAAVTRRLGLRAAHAGTPDAALRGAGCNDKQGGGTQCGTGLNERTLPDESTVSRYTHVATVTAAGTATSGTVNGRRSSSKYSTVTTIPICTAET